MSSMMKWFQNCGMQLLVGPAACLALLVVACWIYPFALRFQCIVIDGAFPSEFGSHNWCVMIFFCISCSKVPLDPYEGILFFDKLWTLHSDVSELLVNPRFFKFSIGSDVLSLSLSVLNVNLFVSRVTVKCEGNS